MFIIYFLRYSLFSVEDTLLEARKELEAELARVTEAKKECQVQLRKLRRDLRRQENQQSGEVEALRRSIARTNAQDAKNRQRIQELHDLIRRAQNRLGEIEREKARLREERDKANADVAQRNETLESLRNRHRDIEQQHQRQTAAAARQTRELQSKLQSVIQQRDDIQHRLERMRDQQLPTQSRDHADLMQRISAANARVEELRRLCETQKTAQEDDDDASMAQVRREIEAAQARNQSLRLLAHDERAFRDRLRDELYSLDNRSKRSTNTATESGPPSDAGARKLITNKVTDFNCRPASVPPPSTTSSL
jgi:chromosome segregation ATPase